MAGARRRLLLCLCVAVVAVAGNSLPATTIAAQSGATVVVHDRAVGRSPRFIGANPGLTTAPNWEAWVRDSRMNAAREWANMEEIEPENEDGVYGDGVSDD